MAGYCIESNPDISGIGVRIAIYAQNLLAFAPVILNVWDGNVESAEVRLKSVQGQSVGILSIAFAILLSTIIEATAPGRGLSNLHTAIVLDLSWMNNTSTFIWFLLYVHHVSDASTQKKPSATSIWLGWTRTISRSLFINDRSGHVTQLEDGETEKQRAIKSQVYHLVWRTVSENLVLSIGSLHLSLMSAIGIWLWSNPSAFGAPTPCDPSITVVGSNVPIISSALRICSLLVYSVLLIPGINLVVPFLFFLALHILFHVVMRTYRRFLTISLTRRSNATLVDSNLVTSGAPEVSISTLNHSSTDLGQQRNENDTIHIGFLYAGIICLLAIDLVFLIDIELTVARNQHLQDQGENDWGFGQVLALLLLVVPLKDLATSITDIRRRLRQQKEHEDQLKKRTQDYFRTTLQQAVKAKSLKGHDFEALVTQGADPNTKIEGDNLAFVAILELAAYRGDERLVKILCNNGADLNLKGGKYSTALQAASRIGNDKIVRLLLEHGADPNVTGGRFGAPLQAASLMGMAPGKHEAVKLLLAYGANVNFRGGHYETALQAAAGTGNFNAVELLLKNHADVNAFGGYFGTALQGAAYCMHYGIVNLLLEHGADVNIVGGFYGTALQAASFKGKIRVVQLLLEKGADPNLIGGEYETALQAASLKGKDEVVRLLIEYGAESKEVLGN